MKKKLSVVATGLVALVALGAASPTPSAFAAGAAAVTTTAPAALASAPAPMAADRSTAKKKRPKKFAVRPGVTLANPLNDTRNAINQKVLRSIDNARRGSIIRLASWNFDSWPYVTALTRAHRRGVSVRLLMARTMAENQGGGGPFAALRTNLAGAGNAQRKLADRSWARTCDHSCRGKGGAMHAKYYIFSRVGNSKKVVMNTSANLTAAAGRGVQWNDLYTTVGREKTYDQYMLAFKQATADKPAPHLRFRDGDITGFFFPLYNRKHPAMQMLDQVRCQGAKGAGTNGRTAIRVAQDVFNNEIGRQLALKLLKLHRRGCDVKVVYSQAVGASREIIKKLPHNHLVQDTNGDGAYDRYLHAKVLAISGRYGKNRGERIVLNGSANWSGTAIQSDEQGMIIDRDGIEKQYGAWINQMFRTHLVSVPYNPELDPDNDDPELRRVVLDPYREMEG